MEPNAMFGWRDGVQERLDGVQVCSTRRVIISQNRRRRSHTSEIDLTASLQNCTLILPVIVFEIDSWMDASSTYYMSGMAYTRIRRTNIECSQGQIARLSGPRIEGVEEEPFIVLLANKVFAV